MKKVLFILFMAFYASINIEAQSYSQGFEASAVGPFNAPSWFVVSGNPKIVNTSPNGNNTATISPFEGNRMVRLVAQYDSESCGTSSTPAGPGLEVRAKRWEGIALNRPFVQGRSYKISYSFRGNDNTHDLIVHSRIKSILTSGLAPKTPSGLVGCANTDFVPPVTPANSQTISEDFYSKSKWVTVNMTFTANDSYSQLWIKPEAAPNDPNLPTEATYTYFFDDLKITECARLDPTFTYTTCRVGNNLEITATANTNNTNNHWSVYEAIDCAGGTDDSNMVGASATTAPVPISVLATTNGTGNTASFTVPYGKCYIVKHGTWGGDCNSVWTEERQMINNTNLPRLDNTFTVTAFPSGTGLVVEARPLTLAPVLGVHAFQLEIVNASGNLTNLGTTTFLVTPSSKLSDVVAKWNLACGVTYRVTHSVFMASSKICNRSTRTSFDIRRPCETRTERETEIVIVPSPTNAGGRSIEVTNDSKEEIVSEFNIYPNPAQDFINITYNIQSDAHLSLYNQLGQEVYTTNISKEDNAKTIDSSILENGFYLVMLKDVSGKVLEHKKLMIQK